MIFGATDGDSLVAQLFMEQYGESGPCRLHGFLQHLGEVELPFDPPLIISIIELFDRESNFDKSLVQRTKNRFSRNSVDAILPYRN